MKVAVFSTKSYDRTFLETANAEYGHELVFFEPRLTCETSVLSTDFPAVCVFVNDQLDRKTLTCLAERGTKLIALRAAGYNNVDINAAAELGLTVVRVPAYSPHAVAEYTVGMILTLNRKIYRAHYRVREGNFSLEGLMGFDLHGKTAGIVGTGKIGAIVAQILHACGCHVLAYDQYQNPDCQALGVQYVSLQELFTYHLINSEAIALMKTGMMLINTSRGALIDTKAAIKGLKSGKIGYLGLDVYEQEGDIFFEDLSNTIVQDDVLQRLLTFPNVLITGHQAFFTEDALTSIAHTTLANISDFEAGKPCPNQVVADRPPAVGSNVK
jgi:D-lactate dehydrogenase